MFFANEIYNENLGIKIQIQMILSNIMEKLESRQLVTYYIYGRNYLKILEVIKINKN